MDDLREGIAMTKGLARTLALYAACVLLAAPPAAHAKKAPPAPPAAAPTGGDNALGKVVDEMTKYTAPGPQHQELAQLVGSWTTRTRVWERPDATPVEFPGSAEYRTILGGRFLELASRSQLGGKESNGIGIFGYDAFKEKYSYYYIHDGETQALTGLGVRDSTTGAIAFTVAMDMPMSGGHDVPIRAVLRRVSGNRHVFEIFEKYVDDREWKVLEITYDRH
jgi:uncharacterized protein DUF1579